MIEALLDTLKQTKDVEILKTCIETLDKILTEGKAHYNVDSLEKNPYLERLSQSNGKQIIENFDHHPDQDVFRVVTNLIENHFD